MAAKVKRSFNFAAHKQRYIALKLLYFGWDYDGLASQENSQNTIEHHLFRALTITCLIESRDKCQYNRCGRTDKGVSSYGQVVNLCIRSNLIDEEDPRNVGLFTPENYNGSNMDSNKERTELEYVDILNRTLPENIKAIAWAPVNKDFSSRFSCQSRSYSYIFPVGDLDTDLMQEAANYLVGEHDFRNLCSFDLKNGVRNHKRYVKSAQITALEESVKSSRRQYSFCQFVIVGQAFLYHQIRCIVSILFLVGSRKESPRIVKDMLDLETCPSRPNYNKASPLPLSLFDCDFDPNDLPKGWIYDEQPLRNLFRKLKQIWFQQKTKTLMIERVLFDIEARVVEKSKSEDSKLESSSWRDFGLECDNMSDRKYISLLKRPRDETLESKLEAIEAKRSR